MPLRPAEVVGPRLLSASYHQTSAAVAVQVGPVRSSELRHEWHVWSPRTPCSVPPILVQLEDEGDLGCGTSCECDHDGLAVRVRLVAKPHVGPAAGTQSERQLTLEVVDVGVLETGRPVHDHLDDVALGVRDGSTTHLLEVLLEVDGECVDESLAGELLGAAAC